MKSKKSQPAAARALAKTLKSIPPSNISRAAIISSLRFRHLAISNSNIRRVSRWWEERPSFRKMVEELFNDIHSTEICNNGSLLSFESNPIKVKTPNIIHDSDLVDGVAPDALPTTITSICSAVNLIYNPPSTSAVKTENLDTYITQLCDPHK